MQVRSVVKKVLEERLVGRELAPARAAQRAREVISNRCEVMDGYTNIDGAWARVHCESGEDCDEFLAELESETEEWLSSPFPRGVGGGGCTLTTYAESTV